MGIYLKLQKLAFVLGTATISLMATTTLFATQSSQIIQINDAPIPFDTNSGQPITKEGRTYVPLRILGESLGIQTNWNASTQSITFHNQIHTISLQIGSPYALVNGTTTYIDALPLIVMGRTYVPIRFITETLGYQVSFKDGITYINTTQATTPDQPISPWDYQSLLGKGMDVDWSKTSQGKDNYHVQAVKDFKSQGISHVRIRVKDPADEQLFAALDAQIQDCLDNDIIPIIAYQADEFKNQPTPKNIRQVVQWWDTVATHYKDYSHRLSFDLIIEVTDALNKEPDTLNTIYDTLVTTIRESNPTRILMMSPRLRSDAAYLKELKIPTQHNNYLMAEWHFYASGPSKDNPRKLWTIGTPQEKALITEKINLALEWQTQTGIPTWVGAWMPGNYNDSNDYTISEQIVFARYMTEQLTQAKIPFAVNSDTKFYDRSQNQWIEEMLPVRDAIWHFKPTP